MKKKISIITLSIIISIICCFSIFKMDTKAETTSTYYTFTEGGATLVNVDMALFNTGWKAIVLNCQFYANYDGFININYVWNPSNPGWMNYNIITDNCVMTARTSDHITLHISNSSEAQIIIAGSATNIAKMQITTVTTSGFTYCSDITDLTDVTTRIESKTQSILTKLTNLETLLSGTNTMIDAYGQSISTILQWCLTAETDVQANTVSTWPMGYYKELTTNATYYNSTGYVNGNNGKIYLDLTTNKAGAWNGYFLVNHFYRLFLRTGNQGSDIDIVQNFKFNGIWIFNVNNGEKHFYDTSYYKHYLINSSGTTTLYLWDIYIPFNSSYKLILEFTGSSNNNTVVFNSSGSTVSDWTYTQDEYYELSYQFSVLDGIERIINAIGDISIEQTTNIDNTYNDLTVYNQQINNITNNYNDDIDDMLQNVDLQDLINVDPNSQDNILPSINYYNSVFLDLINIQGVKSILIFVLLCILIVALVG